MAQLHGLRISADYEPSDLSGGARAAARALAWVEEIADAFADEVSSGLPGRYTRQAQTSATDWFPGRGRRRAACRPRWAWAEVRRRRGSSGSPRRKWPRPR